MNEKGMKEPMDFSILINDMNFRRHGERRSSQWVRLLVTVIASQKNCDLFHQRLCTFDIVSESP